MRRRTLLNSGQKNIFTAKSSNNVTYWQDNLGTTITITASGDWTVWSDVDWIKFSKESGTGDAKVYANCTDNRSYYARWGGIYVSSDGKTLEFGMTQLDYWAWTIESDAIFVCHDGNLILTSDAGSASAVIDIDANPNEQFEFSEAYSETFSVSPTNLSAGRNNVTLSWNGNTTGDILTRYGFVGTYHRAAIDGQVWENEIFSLKQMYFPVSEALYINYDVSGAEKNITWEYSEERADINANGDFDIIISANGPWVMQKNGSVSLSKYDGFGDDVVHVTRSTSGQIKATIEINGGLYGHFGWPCNGYYGGYILNVTIN